MSLALEHHLAGRLAEAEILYGRILDAEPRQPDALHLLGVLAGQTGRPDRAAALIGEAMALRPDTADYPSNLGNALAAAGRPAPAAAAYRRALALAPAGAACWGGLGIVLHQHGDDGAAVAALERAARLDPDDAASAGRAALLLHRRGLAERDAGRRAAAAAVLRRAVGLRPDEADLRFDAAHAAHAAGDRAAAEGHLQRALALRPDHADAWVNLGGLRQDTGRPGEGVRACRRALALQPEDVAARVNAAAAYDRLGQHGMAAAACRRALALDPAHAGALSNLAGAAAAGGRVEAAVALLRRALALRPDDRELHSRYLCTLLYRTGQDGAGLLAESRRWAARFATPEPLPPPDTPADTLEDPGRRLRVGFVSGDFRNHAFAFYLEPLFGAFDRTVLELVLYSTVTAPDATTLRFRALADRWRDAAGLDDEELARQVRHDGVDVLVDLGSHTAGNRLGVFARRPAPVQATTAVNVVTTGLDRFDACITDRFLAPPGEEAHYAEPLLRLPRFSWAYRGPPEAPEVAPPPALRNGFVTFGSFNNLSKLTEETAALWARVLHAVPGARLLMKYMAMRDPDTRARVAGLFGRLGVADRLELRPPPAGLRAHLADYGDVDIALDSFPYNGHTTTCEALWMGVPVLVLAARPHELGVARVGEAMLANAGLADLIAGDADAFVAKAVALAGDAAALAVRRAGLRAQVAASPLGDVPALARAYEGAFRALWRRRRRSA
ncbi:tetratricopeptide repeat protein [Azospirillum sp. ST 5-10]|uniref:tetratricopeptide repeat protein n=1 Tax=unclassified Azospirillum TaxID=2630922 RepID=UPI003F4A2EF1